MEISGDSRNVKQEIVKICLDRIIEEIDDENGVVISTCEETIMRSVKTYRMFGIVREYK